MRGGRTLRVVSSGAGPATPVVLVHGVGLGERSMRPLARLLARRGRVHAVELPGFGRTPHAEPVLTMQQHAGVLTAWLRTLGGPVVLVGHSMGAAVAAIVAVREPALVQRLVLISPVTDPAARSLGRQALRLAADALREPPRTVATVLAEYAACGPLRYVRTRPSMAAFDLDAVAGRIGAPVLLVRGAHDALVSAEWCAALPARFRDARLAVVDGGGHLVLHSRPGAVAARIAAFLEGVPA